MICRLGSFWVPWPNPTNEIRWSYETQSESMYNSLFLIELHEQAQAYTHTASIMSIYTLHITFIEKILQ